MVTTLLELAMVVCGCLAQNVMDLKKAFWTVTTMKRITQILTQVMLELYVVSNIEEILTQYHVYNMS